MIAGDFLRAIEVLRNVQVRDEFDAESVVEGNLLLSHERALRKSLVPREGVGGDCDVRCAREKCDGGGHAGQSFQCFRVHGR